MEWAVTSASLSINALKAEVVNITDPLCFHKQVVISWK